uniref:DNA topoisomerase (ATP-hydrolyzing) n=1 Tax=viral metagenome TaxID=1070528 RepID=A0A6C0APK8_9ZZZZ
MTDKFESYEILSHEEHVLKLPDTYIGSTSTSGEQRWLIDSVSNKMVWKTVQCNPGLYKLYDEILVNARDAFVRAATTEGRQPIKHIDITVKKGESEPVIISVENDGDGIPVEEHPTEKCYIPELIFGRLLTSSNYTEGEEKIVGGKNGYGAKLANIFSSRFSVTTSNPASGKKYSQTWHKNMSVRDKPSIRKLTGSKGSVLIEFAPDASRFVGAFQDGELTSDMLSVFHTRAIELAAMVGSGVKVTWNGAAIPTNTFEKYMKLFLKEGTNAITYENCGPRWEVGAVLARHLYSEEEGMPDEKHISFVNGIQTRKGGKHVEHVVKHVLGDFCEAAKKKKVEIKPGQIKDHVVFFINSTIVNPAFDSQTKEFLTTPMSKFGSSPKFTGKLVDGLIKLGLLEDAKSLLEFKASKEAKKTDGKKRSTLRGIPKLEDALLAGTSKSSDCTLILTEGDSAATSAISGLQVVGRELWGIFPLRGKLLNVKDISIQKFNANEELTALKRILGLEHGKIYKSVKELRYGRVMIMADQDHDGSHIKGLVMNLFHTEWPSLLEAGFLCTLLTPLLKASKGSTTTSFYNIQEFNAWKTTHNNGHGWHVKYYKGLGTSTPAEAKEWFKDLHEIKYEWIGKTCDDALMLAFTKGKLKADDRKEWLSHYNPERTMSVTAGKTNYKEFVDGELIHFSNADNIRSLPHIMDGLKPSQRKILWACLKRNLRSEIKVAQLAGYVSEHAAYHHGEASLNETIVKMAQTFVGSNNINLLKPIGQFGSRLLGGEDSASPRYIHTHLMTLVDKIFRKEDEILLKHVEDDGEKVEPEYYLPVVPLIAINGCIGIGTGFSTDIPPHNPDDIVSMLEHRLTASVDSLSGRALNPWWFGFKGGLVREDTNTWITKGLYEFDESNHTITINDLPVGTWTKNYKIFLDKMLTAESEASRNGLKSFDDLYNDVTVKFVLYMTEEAFDEAVEKVATFESKFKLTTSWKTTNMHCFNTDFSIEKYDTVGDIIEAFGSKRLPAYEMRRVKLLDQIQTQLTELEAKRAFIMAILEGRLDLMRKTDEQVVAGLKMCGIPPLSDPGAADSVKAYEYVLRLRIDRLKASAVAELDEEVAIKKGEKTRLEGETPGTMWLADLAEFKEAWTAYKEARELDMEVGGSTEVVKKGKKTAKVITAPTKPVVKKAMAQTVTTVTAPSNTIIDPSVKTVTVGTTVKLQRKQTVVSTTKA